MCVRDGRVMKNTVQQLRWEFELAICKEGDSIKDYALCLKGTVATLETLDEVVKEPKVVEKMLRSVPACFKVIVLSIHTLLDIEKLTISVLARRLKAAEELFKPLPSMQHDGKLYLTEEWEARREKRDAENHADGSASRSSAWRGARHGHGSDGGSSASIGLANVSS